MAYRFSLIPAGTVKSSHAEDCRRLENRRAQPIVAGALLKLRHANSKRGPCLANQW